MKKIILILTAIIWLCVFNYGAAQDQNAYFQPGRLIIKTTQELDVRFPSNTGIPSIDTSNSYFGVSSIKQLFSAVPPDPQKLQLYNEIGMGRVYILTLPDTADILEAVEDYKKNSRVIFAEPDRYLEFTEVYPCDVFFEDGYEWHLYNRDSSIVPGCKLRADIKAPEAWEIEKGDTNLIVGMVDTGIPRNYDLYGEIKDRVWVNTAEKNGLPGVDDDNNGYTDDSIGWNFCSNTPYVEPNLSSHGYHMSSIIGAETDSTNYCIDGAGINWKCKLMNLKTDTCFWKPNNDTCFHIALASAVAGAIEYGVDNGANVINLPILYGLDAKFAMPESLSAIESGITYAYNSGVMCIASMGNRQPTHDTVWYPASSMRVLAVGATNCEDDRVINGWESSYGLHIDLVAPGLNVWTSIEPSGFCSGTSASASMVSGISSLVMTHRKKLIPSETLTTEDLYEVIRHTSDDTVGNTYSGGEPEDTLCWDEYYGWGRANAFRALVAVSHGDVNNDSQIGTADVTYLIAYLFQGGPPPVPVLEMGDANGDGNVSLSDVVYLISYLYQGGEPPPICYTDCSEP